MHDIRAIRDDPAAFDKGLARRGVAPASSDILAADTRLRAIQTELQNALAQRNNLSKAIGLARAKGDMATADTLGAEVAALKEQVRALETDEQTGKDESFALRSTLPNLPADDVPDGVDETGNQEQVRFGTQPGFAFKPLEHDVLAARLGYDPDTAARIAGARFAVLSGVLARLHRALAQFMLDEQVKAGWRETMVPFLVRPRAAYGTGQLPKFEDDLFILRPKEALSERIKSRTQELIQSGVWPSENFLARLVLENSWEREWKEEHRVLIPTAEVSLTNLISEQIIDSDVLPLRLTALTPCFRSEAGSAGRDTRGLIRQHQFEKVELVSICTPDQAQVEHAHMLKCAEAMLTALGLSFRRMLLCSGDMGFTARRTYDLEVWLPGQNAYREISSISWCGDFQGRRMDARWKAAGEKGTRGFVHTLNGSGLAVGRALVAVLENYQQADGSVIVPEVLHPYMGGITRLSPQ